MCKDKDCVQGSMGPGTGKSMLIHTPLAARIALVKMYFSFLSLDKGLVPNPTRILHNWDHSNTRPLLQHRLHANCTSIIRHQQWHLCFGEPPTANKLGCKGVSHASNQEVTVPLVSAGGAQVSTLSPANAGAKQDVAIADILLH
jgi:hypothetical protein